MDLKDMFVNRDETQITVLGGNYLRNFLSTGSLDKGFCTVTNKRVYFKGKCYYKAGKFYKANKEERIVDLKDITGTGFTYSNLLPMPYQVLLVLGALVCFIVGIGVAFS